MRNVGEEFKNHTEAARAAVKCAIIFLGDDERTRESFPLKVGYSAEEYSAFINTLSDLYYDSGYGGQELFGCIWYEDGTWSERGEYDGSEWWEYKYRPEIPDTLK